MVQARRGPTQAKTQIPSTIIMMFTALLYRRETKARRGDGEYGRLSEEAGRHERNQKAVIIMATPCAKSLGGGSQGHTWSIVLCIQAACSGDTPFARANCTIS